MNFLISVVGGLLLWLTRLKLTHKAKKDPNRAVLHNRGKDLLKNGHQDIVLS